MRVALFTETFLPKVDGIVTMVTKTVETLQAGGDEVMVFAPSGGPAELCGARGGEPALASLPLLSGAEGGGAASVDTEASGGASGRTSFICSSHRCWVSAGSITERCCAIPIVISYHTNLPAYLHYYGLGFFEGPTWKLMRARHQRADLNLCTSTQMMDELRSHDIDRLALWERAVDAQTVSSFEMFGGDAKRAERGRTA